MLNKYCSLKVLMPAYNSVLCICRFQEMDKNGNGVIEPNEFDRDLNKEVKISSYLNTSTKYSNQTSWSACEKFFCHLCLAWRVDNFFVGLPD